MRKVCLNKQTENYTHTQQQTSQNNKIETSTRALRARIYMHETIEYEPQCKTIVWFQIKTLKYISHQWTHTNPQRDAENKQELAYS